MPIASERVSHYSASVQVLPDGDTRSRLIWIVDVLPNEIAPYIDAQMDQGALAVQKTLEEQRRMTTSPFLDALGADGPAADRAGKMELYGRFVGSWDLDVMQFAEDGASASARASGISAGRWKAARSRTSGSSRRAANCAVATPRPTSIPTARRCGSTIPRIDAWRIQWTDPVTQNFLQMIGRRQGDDIVQLGTRPDGQLIRWSFSEITPDSFRWRGEISADEGANWRLKVDFSARRVA